jgi:hypothetical protein
VLEIHVNFNPGVEQYRFGGQGLAQRSAPRWHGVWISTAIRSDASPAQLNSGLVPFSATPSFDIPPPALVFIVLIVSRQFHNAREENDLQGKKRDQYERHHVIGDATATFETSDEHSRSATWRDPAEYSRGWEKR